MKKYIINGNKPLNGEIHISGSKNLALPLLCLPLALKRKCRLNNIPHIKDIEVMLEIFDYLSISHSWCDTNSLLIDPSSFEYKDLTINEISKIRASYYLIGALLPHIKDLFISNQGGCNFEERPIDIHLKMFLDFGVVIKEEKDKMKFSFTKYKTNKIKLKNISFGATINAILFGLHCKEDVYIENVSSECEVDYFISAINESGGKIEKEGNIIIIRKEHEYKEFVFDNIPSRMEIGTFAFIASALGTIKMFPVIKKDLKAIEDVLNMINAPFYYVEESLVVYKRKTPSSIVIETGVYPLFPTDLQPILTSLALSIPRIHVIKENIYKNRFSHVDELKKLGAMILKDNDTILINGIFLLHGAYLKAKDLRGAASLVFGALLSKGESVIENIEYLERGYENFYEKLRSLGGDIGVEE